MGIIPFSDLREYVEWGPDGVRLKVSEGFTNEAVVAAASVEQHETQHGTTIEFKLHDKKGALVLLGRQPDPGHKVPRSFACPVVISGWY